MSPSIDPSIAGRVLELACQIQQIPSPTNNEQARADFVLSAWHDLGLKNAFKDSAGNIYTPLGEVQHKPAIVVSAHLDTVFPPNTSLTLRRTPKTICGSGIGDNSLGVAGLFGLFWALTQPANGSSSQPTHLGDIWLVADVGEEGLGNLRGMKAVVERFGVGPCAYLVVEGMSLGHIYHRGIGVRRYSITVRTPGGHSWVDYGRPSAIHVLAELIVKIKDISLPEQPRSTANIGIITGGTSVNSIASQASCELDLRSETREGLTSLVDRVLSIVEESHRDAGVDVNISTDLIGERPAGEIPADHPLLKLAVDAYVRRGIQADLISGSTDANEPLSRGLPSICVGLTTGGGSHTENEYIDIQPLSTGLGILVDIVQSLSQGNRG